MKKTTAKQIESAKKTIEKLAKVIGTHTAHAQKALSKIGMSYDDFERVSNRWGGYDVDIKDKTKKKDNELYWDIIQVECKIKLCWKKEEELDRTKKRLEQLLEQAAIEDAGEQEQNNRLNPIIATLNRELDSYKNQWLHSSISSASKEFDYCLSNYDKFREEKDSASREYYDYLNYHRRDEDYKDKLRSLKVRYDESTKQFSRVSWVIRWKSDKDGYLADTKKNLESYWESCNRRLAEKLIELSLDIDKAEFHYPRINNGINVIITDGKPRIIDARMIWAATYSSLVTEHIRYIVTTKKTK